MPIPLAAIAGKVAVRAGVSFLQSKKGKALISACLALVLLVPLVFGGAVLMILNSVVGSQSGAASGQAAQIAHCLGDNALYPGSDGGTVPGIGYDAEQTANVVSILSVVKALDLGTGTTETEQKRAGVIALATAMQESSLRNLLGGDRDSQGLFQQRPSQGWGTVAQITNPIYSTMAFVYGVKTARVPGLVDVVGWATLPVTSAAQAVQRSGFPEAYAKHEAKATELVEANWATVLPAIDLPAELARTDIGVTEGVGLIGAGDAECAINEWTPEEGQISFGTWGGYENGKIPLNAMCIIPWKPQETLRCDAAEALIKLNEAWKLDHNGQNMPVSDTYRSFEEQVITKRNKGDLAATPGRSNHGWGLAVDMSGFGAVAQYNTPNYLWFVEHAPAYGWNHPNWARANGVGPREPWHWQYYGIADPDTSKG